MAVRVLWDVEDGRGRVVKVFDSSWNHVVRGHREMIGQEEAIRLTITDPDMVLRPAKRPKGRGIDRRVNCRPGAHSGYNKLWVIVPIDYARKENWLVTAYVSQEPPRGDLIFVRVPLRWS